MANEDTTVAAEVASIMGKESDYKSQLDKLFIIADRVYPNEIKSEADIVPLITLAKTVIALEAGSQVVSRQLITAIADRVECCQQNEESFRILAEGVLAVLDTTSLGFEKEKNAIRIRLAILHEAAGRFIEAADTLRKIPTDCAQRPSSPAQKMELYLKIGRLLLESGDYAEAEQYVNRASMLQAEKDCDVYNVEYKAIYARVLDGRRKFTDAAQRYHELSMVVNLPESDQKVALSRSITCTILAAPGHGRSRMLVTLFKDPRAAQLPSFPLLEKLYLDRLIKASELIEFERELLPHQRTNEHGQSIVEGVIVEHNMTAVSRLYNNIALSTLAELLGISPEKAEEIVAQMISSERLTGYIDQLEGFIHFEQRDSLKLWDEQIMMFCQLVNKVCDMIIQQHPDILVS
ncbi:PCI domain protein [Dictyocaulus viviparus]|uniref:COP9 signalosome complex subunit 4 n=1 Tax=Dictyocaulus viviparus TaxID=29172 RepID=A0A0D8XMD6_DICVI|nr:PCI domain protein [Dictyocaulus viviparus]